MERVGACIARTLGFLSHRGRVASHQWDQCRRLLLQSQLMSEDHLRRAEEFCQNEFSSRSTRIVYAGASVAICALGVCVSTLCVPLLCTALVFTGLTVVVQWNATMAARMTRDFISTAAEAKSVVTKCVRLLTENHVLARGMTLMRGGDTMDSVFTDRLGTLLEVCDSSLSNMNACYTRFIQELREKHSLINNDMARQLPEIDKDTSKESITRIKANYRVFQELQSSFVLRLLLGLCPELLSPSCSQPTLPVDVVRRACRELALHCRPLIAAYRYHVTPSLAESPDQGECEGGRMNEKEQMPNDAIYTNAHSIYLQCEALAMLGRVMERILTQHRVDNLRDCYKQVEEHVATIKNRSTNVQLMCNQIQFQIARFLDSSDDLIDKTLAQESSTPPPSPEVWANDLDEPAIVNDEFLEAISDESAAVKPDEHEHTEEEIVKRQLDSLNTRNLLKELDSALQGKRREWEMREAVAKGTAFSDNEKEVELQSSSEQTETSQANPSVEGKCDIPRSEETAKTSMFSCDPEINYPLTSFKRVCPPTKRQPPSRNGLHTFTSLSTADEDSEEQNIEVPRADSLVDENITYEPDPEPDSSISERNEPEESLADPVVPIGSLAPDDLVSQTRVKFDPRKVCGFGFSPQMAARAAAVARSRKSQAEDESFE